MCRVERTEIRLCGGCIGRGDAALHIAHPGHQRNQLGVLLRDVGRNGIEIGGRRRTVVGKGQAVLRRRSPAVHQIAVVVRIDAGIEYSDEDGLLDLRHVERDVARRPDVRLRNVVLRDVGLKNARVLWQDRQKQQLATSLNEGPRAGSVERAGLGGDWVEIVSNLSDRRTPCGNGFEARLRDHGVLDDVPRQRINGGAIDGGELGRELSASRCLGRGVGQGQPPRDQGAVGFRLGGAQLRHRNPHAGSIARQKLSVKARCEIIGQRRLILNVVGRERLVDVGFDGIEKRGEFGAACGDERRRCHRHGIGNARQLRLVGDRRSAGLCLSR